MVLKNKFTRIEKQIGLKELITNELNILLSNLDNDTKRLSDLVNTFISETPQLFLQIEELIKLGKSKEASEVVHKVKSRYGYLGLDKVMEDLTKWENDLESGRNTGKSDERISKFKKINLEVMTELKQTKFHQGDEDKKEIELPLTGKLVLVAEDDEINAIVFELLIKETGASVIIAGDGNEAFKLTLEKSPDMIFMDVHMPYFSGLDATKELRKKGIKCPIISLSASTRLNERQNSLDAGADDFLIKPVNRESINKVLMEYLG
jgi:CheY-like chemotaxis protein/HPt (histidine-containing phosphotransfer) domain-containing protein